ncbi:MAG TPA: peptidylprolyl isomerase [Bacteroidales bacterium]|nr:peptidylprolyl isomerase [Bacteroidales bacterium]HRW96191.1 peptidylprolyl isomerase [Bacteroidales bacterium]
MNMKKVSYSIKTTLLSKSLLSIVLTALISITAVTLAAQKTADPVLLKIDNQDITVSEFMSVYQKNNVEGEVLDRKSLEEYLDLYINFKLKVKEAEELGLDTVSSFINELKGYRDQLAKPYFVDDKLNEKLLHEAYARKKTDIRASHILISIDQYAPPADTLEAYNKIMEIRKRIVENKEDFGEVAMEVSDDPSARDMPARGFQPARKGNKGDIGYFSVFDMVYPFEDVAYKLNVGEVSMPVRTQFGYHLIKLQDKKPALGKVQVAHLFLQLPQEADDEKINSLKIKADSLYDALKNGAVWDSLVRKFSDDKSSAVNGGVLPWFGSNRMVPQFIDGIRSIEDSGQISKPVLTSYGWHIIKLIDVKPIGSFEDEKENLKQSLTKDIRANLSKEAIINRIKEEAHFTRNDKAVEDFYQVIDSSIYSRKWTIEQAEGLNKTIARLGKEEYNQQDFAQFLAKNQSINPKETVPQFIDRIFNKFTEEKVIQYEDARLEEKYPEFRALVKEYRDGILLFELTDQKVWSKAIKDTTGLKEFYEKNRDNYIWGDRADAILFISSTREGIEKAHNMATERLSVDQIKEAFEADENNTITILEKKFPKNEEFIIDNIEWKKGISPIVQENEERFGFAVIKDLVPPEHKTLSEARGIITADYQNYLEEEWLKQLRNKYTVIVNQDVLSTIK